VARLDVRPVCPKTGSMSRALGGWKYWPMAPLRVVRGKEEVRSWRTVSRGATSQVFVASS
jgi:hypothetical protein